MVTAHSSSGTWDIFCKVVDNYGDAGVCWRLARMLAGEHQLHVRLWIDNPAVLQALHPALDISLPEQQAAGVTVINWNACTPDPVSTAVIVEGFGCGLPDAYVAAMGGRAKPPLWIVLEYLSGEAWVDEHHGLASPHPRLPLPRYFFFPGFTAASGGLLREHDLLQRRDAFGTAQRHAFWRRLGFDSPDSRTLTLSLFSYADAPVAELLSAMAEGDAPVVVAVPQGSAMSAVDAYLGKSGSVAKSRLRGRLEVRSLPFLPQDEYDELLWACDLNLVRGEDSFVRAQWAARPLVWQPYRQDDGVHQRKMEAFLDRYCVGLAPETDAVLRAFWRVWNGESGVATSWRGMRQALPVLAGHAGLWAAHLAGFRNLATQLVGFARDRVK
ncbi:MAG: elongation factor P maturation arginine rhamnosyltransferase EarP [Burkholderiales bacterium]